MLKLLKKIWDKLTWIEVICPDCDGTGICKQPNTIEPHSCCGECDRKRVSRNLVPKGWIFTADLDPIIGTGKMYKRLWSSKLYSRRS